MNKRILEYQKLLARGNNIQAVIDANGKMFW
jgi:hypothetical protein